VQWAPAGAVTQAQELPQAGEGEALVWLSATDSIQARRIAGHLTEEGVARRVSVMGSVETFGGQGFGEPSVREVGMVAVVLRGREVEVRREAARLVLGLGAEEEEEGAARLPRRGSLQGRDEIASLMASQSNAWATGMGFGQDGEGGEEDEDDEFHAALLGW
jgi:hypothetical protein